MSHQDPTSIWAGLSIALAICTYFFGYARGRMARFKNRSIPKPKLYGYGPIDD